MTGDFCAIKLVRSILNNHDHWTVEAFAPFGMEDISQKAKLHADKRLFHMNILLLYIRFNKWAKSEPIIGREYDYYECFLSDLSYVLGGEALERRERYLYEELCYLKFHFKH